MARNGRWYYGVLSVFFIVCAEIVTVIEPDHEIMVLFVLHKLNSFFKCTCAAIQLGEMSDFWSHSLSSSILICANNEGSGKTAWMHRLA